MFFASKIKILFLVVFLAGFPLLSFSRIAIAQEQIALSITPPLININMSPGELWKSTIKVINNSPEEVSVYVRAVDFKASKTGAPIEFVENNFDSESFEGDSPFLSHWIIFEEPKANLSPYGSKEIPFIIKVPEDATPGGHYAAIWSGTTPPSDTAEGSVIKISTLLSTLILLRINGEINEEGAIREFSSRQKYYSEAKADFTVRFENRGNVHLQPSGDINIYDVFNKKREAIKINQNSDFGNVLPEETRAWNFSWEGDGGILDMGRYRAELYLNFGENGVQTDNRILYFWVLYPKLLAILGISVFIFIAILILLIKFSIRRALRETQNLIENESRRNASISFNQTKTTKQKASKPNSGVIDLKK